MIKSLLAEVFLYRQSHKTRLAFTLAEILITLGVIGVVAAMTIPTLMANHQERKTVVALKKFYSTISQSYRYALEEYGTPDGWYDGVEDPTTPNFENAQVMGEKLTKYMKKVQDCQTGDKCFGDKYTKIDGRTIMDAVGNTPNNHTKTKSYATLDGMSFFVYSYGPNSESLGTGDYAKSYGAITVDINGKSKPNCFGRDTFSFIMTENSIMPFGGKNVEGDFAFPNSCNRTDCYNLCEACSAWVITHGNMDYFRHDDLHW